MLEQQEEIISGTESVVRGLIRNLPDGVVKSYLYSTLPEVIGFFWSVIFAIIVYVIGARLITLVIKLIRKPLELRKVEKGAIQFITSMARAILYAVLFVVILTLFGVSTASIAAAVASIALTAGLALQGSLSNLAGGILILVLRPFVVGDYIIEDTHRNEGVVSEITIFYTKLKTIDHKVIVIPNGALANSSLTNATMSDKRMIHLNVGIGYNDDLAKAKGILEQIVEDEEKRLAGEETQVYVDELGESAVVLGLRFWVATADYWTVRWRTLEEIKLSFDANGIGIPYNQLDVHLVKD
ncbi:MAG: mechanosensitive ion channel [Lachnospiraceae bacterium]|nr:mechanosensitive ion channel [Lachnospiraceae bacterium]